jgi:D-lactate dehydrogenase
MTAEGRLLNALRGATAPDRVLDRELDRVAFASDASMYHLVPRAVVLAKDEKEVAAVLAVARAERLPVTFRAAGTSLSGQGVTDGILVEVARHWKGATVEAEGARIRARPGMIGAHLNAILAPHGTRLGPDPSSLAACTLGGILANNSSGPCSGVEQSSYHTLESLKLLLVDGTAVDTAEGDDALRAKAPAIHAGLLALRASLMANEPLRRRVERKYRTKNTTGYGLNALLDFERSVDILAHLMVGSEGTLGFVSEAVLRTVPLLPRTSTAFLLFPSLQGACAGIVPFRSAGTQLVELLDEASLRSIARLPGLPAGLDRLPRGSAALLVQAQGATGDELAEREGAALDAARGLSPMGGAEFSRDARRQAQLLHARKGLYPAVGGQRAAGTSVLLEDVAFPVDRLAEGASDLQGLFRTHGYGDGIIFGHAKDGNLHFLVTQEVGSRPGVDRYARFLDDVVELVVGKHDGALKAEHGTGRNMAPFVEREWGADGIDLMRRIKTLFDPGGILNPGVILPASPRAHLDHLKTTPPVAYEVDRCVECGYCESVCPSRALTLTPRQRIVVQRERARRLEVGDGAGVAALDRGWAYAGLDTCATDGMCATACPVNIDTGSFVIRQRAERRGDLARGVAGFAASAFGLTTTLARLAVRAGALAGLDLPRPGERAPHPSAPGGSKAIYFPSCTSRMFKGDGDPFLKLAARAGMEILVPEGLEGMCCGLAFRSKGFPDAAMAIGGRTRRVLIELSEAHGIPVIADGSSCGLELDEHFPGLTFDSVIFAWKKLLPRLTIRRQVSDLAIHIPCSGHGSDVGPAMREIARAVAGRVFEPTSSGCCGFAGDRGITHPELTASATAPMAQEIRAAGCSRGVGSNLPCQVAMTRATGIEFRGILTVLEEVTR